MSKILYDYKNYIKGLDGIRAILILYIINAHFGQFLSTHPLFLAITKQHNMIVGAFFLLSGFVLSLNQHSKESIFHFFKKRFFRIYPLYLIAFLIFMPIYIFIDLHYQNSWQEIIEKIAVHFLLLQAWSPKLAQAYNSPMWFLSSLTFCYIVFVPIINFLNSLSKTQRIYFLSFLWLILFTIRIVYTWICGEQNIEGLNEIACQPWFDWFRFFPISNAIEFVLGMIIATLYIDIEKKISSLSINWLVITCALSLLAILVIRIYLPVNDLLARTIFFLPIFGVLIFFLPQSSGWVINTLEHPIFRGMGKISFAMFILHSPIGQLFYKKAIKQHIWAYSPHYFIYLITVFLTGYISYRYIESYFYHKK